jgi:tetratricopeptide (TPR) repeat protein
MIHKIGFLISSSMLFFSCGSNTSSEQKQEVVKKDTVVVAIDECSKFLTEAKRLDNILLKATVVNPEIADKAVKAFYDFSTNCKTDTLAPVFLVKAGQVSQSIRKYSQAQSYFKKCIEDFPKFKSRGAAMFLLAQLYDDATMLNDESQARALYDQVMREYPDSPYANDSKACIKNLGKTDEQLIQEFLKKNK